MKKTIVNGQEFKCYITHSKIKKRVVELAKAINKEYEGRTPLFIPVLNGSFMFASDLLKNVSIQSNVSFIKIQSYDGMKSSGKTKELIGLDHSIEGRDIIIVEDIIDTGLTMEQLLKAVNKLKPASVKVATLLFKRECLQKPIEPDYVGFEIPGRFVVGYGLDFDGYGRNLKHIYKAVLE
ncbi:MAG: hypoxanthine phosphoribosyltransferase [Flavobacteriaceae bacterium]|nr:hypoxanthine phosphoribosyltransferase [Flavobacteriaceae bacterium]